MDILDIRNGPTFDETLWEKEYHTHTPYASSKLKNNDEIRIPIQQQDVYTLPSESYLYIEGQVTKKDGTVGTTVPFISNPMAFLFEEIRYELSGIIIDSTKRVGVSSTLKGMVSFSPSEINQLRTSGWLQPDKNDFTPATNGYFDFCIPLKMLLGFAEDYKRILINVKQELVLLRASTDYDLIQAPATATTTTLDWKIDLQKIVWRVPHVRLADEHRITLLKQLNSDREIVLPFRNWEMHEYPTLPKSKRQSWAVKTSNQIEKPRYVIVAFQTKQKNEITANAGLFKTCKLNNIKLFLNSQFFPYDNVSVEFSKTRYSVLYDMYARFQSSYYGTANQPLLSPDQFQSKAPIVIIDCSKQNESVKSSTVDIRLEMEFEEEIPDDTSAYCLILHDSIVTYTPLTGIVKRVL
jgi:hypothetical protein